MPKSGCMLLGYDYKSYVYHETVVFHCISIGFAFLVSEIAVRL